MGGFHFTMSLIYQLCAVVQKLIQMNSLALSLEPVSYYVVIHHSWSKGSRDFQPSGLAPLRVVYSDCITGSRIKNSSETHYGQDSAIISHVVTSVNCVLSRDVLCIAYCLVMYCVIYCWVVIDTYCRNDPKSEPGTMINENSTYVKVKSDVWALGII